LKIKSFAKMRNYFIYTNLIPSKLLTKFICKNFAKKYKTVIKPINSDGINNSDNNLKNKSQNVTSSDSYSQKSFFKNQNENNKSSENEEYKIKPEFREERRGDESGLNIMSKFDDKKIQNFYSDLRNTAMNLEDSGVKRMYLWYTAHIIPSLCFIPNFFNFAFVYQIFWVSSSMGLAYSSYEFYSTPKEKKILDNHIRLGYLMCMAIILIAVVYKINNDEDLKRLIEIFNSLNFVIIYAFFAFKRREFYIPIWLKQSMRFFLPLMMIYSLTISATIFNNSQAFRTQETSNLKVSDEQVALIQQRYLREFSSKKNKYFY
jgi:hypothetical protein